MIHGLCDGLNWSSTMYNNPNHVYRSEKIFQSFTLMEDIHMYISQQKKYHSKHHSPFQKKFQSLIVVVFLAVNYISARNRLALCVTRHREEMKGFTKKLAGEMLSVVFLVYL